MTKRKIAKTVAGYLIRIPLVLGLGVLVTYVAYKAAKAEVAAEVP